MPTQSISNNNGLTTIQPIKTPKQSVEPLTDEQLRTKINQYLSEGIKNNLSQDYVARQIETLARENPDLASNSGLTDYQSIKKGVELAYQAGAGNRPLALASSSNADLFQWGVNIEADKRILPKPMTPEEQQAFRDTGKELLTLVAAATAATTGAYLLPIARTLATYTAQELMVFAASPQGQQIAKDALDCLESIQDYSPPTGTDTGIFCGATKYFYDKFNHNN